MCPCRTRPTIKAGTPVGRASVLRSRSAQWLRRRHADRSAARRQRRVAGTLGGRPEVSRFAMARQAVCGRSASHANRGNPHFPIVREMGAIQGFIRHNDLGVLGCCPTSANDSQDATNWRQANPLTSYDRAMCRKEAISLGSRWPNSRLSGFLLLPVLPAHLGRSSEPSRRYPVRDWSSSDHANMRCLPACFAVGRRRVGNACGVGSHVGRSEA